MGAMFRVVRKNISGSFLNAMQNRRRAWKAVKLSAKLVVPPSMQWWYWQEFGTAVGGRNLQTDPTGGASGHTYEILPKNAEFLSWPDGSGGRVVAAFVKKHPGVPSHHFVTRSLADIQKVASSEIAVALHDGNWQFGKVKRALLTKVMPQAREIIAKRMEQTIPGVREDGKLHGSLAADFFRGLTSIVDSSSE